MVNNLNALSPFTPGENDVKMTFVWWHGADQNRANALQSAKRVMPAMRVMPVLLQQKYHKNS